MNEHLTKEILDFHFRYFTYSLFEFSDRYLNLIFKTSDEIEKHVAYLCPLCVSNYILLKKDGVFATSEFSMDHIPPESVGGNLKLLICKKCNNDAGGLYESELITKMKYHAANFNTESGHFKISTKISDIEGNYKGFMKKVGEGRFSVDYPEKLKQKASFLKNWLATKPNNDEWEIQIKIYKPDDKKVSKALLKAAYLICFMNWGYDFVFSHNGMLLRNHINEEHNNPIDLIPFWIDNDSQKNLPVGLCYIDKPIEMESFIVNIPMKIDGYSAIASVAIPSVDDNEWNKIKFINQFIKDNSSTPVTFRKLGAPITAKKFYGYSESLKS